MEILKLIITRILTAKVLLSLALILWLFIYGKDVIGVDNLSDLIEIFGGLF